MITFSGGCKIVLETPVLCIAPCSQPEAPANRENVREHVEEKSEADHWPGASPAVG